MPWPIGIYLQRSNLRPQLDNLDVHEYADYANYDLGPFGCTRNAYSSLYLWKFIKRHSHDYHVRNVSKQLSLVTETLLKMQKNPIVSKYCAPKRLHPFSLTIILEVPSDENFYKKWGL
jgi:hypothetical protein